MTMPGFTAETSVYRRDARYRMTAGVDASGNGIRPQACDLDCLGECLDGCTGSGREHAACVRLCRSECGCTIPPPPPPQCTCTKRRCCQGSCSTQPIAC